MQEADDIQARDQWLDVARGLGIVLVVWGHVVRGLFNAGLAQPDRLGALDQIIYLFHMPLFFFLAGVNVERSRRHGDRAFVVGKLKTVAWPYFLWSAFQLSVMLALGAVVNTPVSAGDLLAIPWRPQAPFWFLYALFVSQMAVLLVPRNRLAWLALALAAALATAWLPPAEILQRTAFGLLFVVLGMCGVAPRLAGWKVIALCVLGFALAATVLVKPEFRLAWPIWTAPVAALGVAATVALSREIKGKAAVALAWLGSASMTIFVLHILAASGARIVLHRLGIDQVPVQIAVGVTAGLVGPSLAHVVLKRLGLLPWLGLGRGHSAARLRVSGAV
jgi:fucose 4-O-acetylase-like acetyltransferase